MRAVFDMTVAIAAGLFAGFLAYRLSLPDAIVVGVTSGTAFVVCVSLLSRRY